MVDGGAVARTRCHVSFIDNQPDSTELEGIGIPQLGILATESVGKPFPHCRWIRCQHACMVKSEQLRILDEFDLRPPWILDNGHRTNPADVLPTLQYFRTRSVERLELRVEVGVRQANGIDHGAAAWSE